MWYSIITEGKQSVPKVLRSDTEEDPNIKFKRRIIMKNENVQKINKVGKVTWIITSIAKVLMIIGMVCTLIVGIFLLMIPKGAINVNGDVSAVIDVDETKLGKTASKMFEQGTLFETPERHIDFDHFGIKFKYDVDKNETSDTEYGYVINGSVEELNAKSVSTAMAIGTFSAMIFEAALLVAIIFGSKLAKSLANCDSPFEEKVIKAMKHFGYSLLPFIIIHILAHGILNLITLISVIVILLFIYIFSYGAQLQKESDETL